LKAVRLAVLTFLPHLAGRNILFDEDNHALCYVMAGLTSRSPEMITELRRLWYGLDTIDIDITPWYIRSAAITLANKLSRHLDSNDWQLDPSVFHAMDTQFGPHTIDRFASALNVGYFPVTTQNGSTRRAKQWTPFTSPIHLGKKKTIGATRHGPYYPTLPEIYSRAAQQP
jgi:hypothetical protein